MKRIFLLFWTLCLLFSCDSAIQVDYLDESGNVEVATKSAELFTNDSVSEVLVQDARIEVENGVTKTKFSAVAPFEGDYYLSIFMFPEDNSSYKLVGNGETILGVLIPNTLGWQTVVLTASDGQYARVHLQTGNNSLELISSSNDCPEIGAIRMMDDDSDFIISSEEYDNYFNRMKYKGNFETKSVNYIAPSSSTLNNLNPYYVRYHYEHDCQINYSLTKTIVLNQNNNQLTLTFSNVTEDLIVDVFKDWVYTISATITSTNNVFTQNFPPGTYTLHLRKKMNGYDSIVNLLVSTSNSTFGYSNCVVSGEYIDCSSASYGIHTSSNLVYFTCMESAGSDPVLYLCNRTNQRVQAFNDNYSGTGDFQWGNNARLSCAATSTPYVHYFNASPISPAGSCDIYCRLPMYWRPNDELGANYPMLKEDDTIMSGPQDDSYNCIGWAGETMDPVWPYNEGSPFYTTGYGWEINGFDLYFSWRGYTRSGADEDNAGVALWVKDGRVTHASIRNNSVSNYPHGYDWESKLGATQDDPRIFHVRDDIMGQAFGYIGYYYRPNASASTLSYETESVCLSEEAVSIERRYLQNESVNKQKVYFDLLYERLKEYCEAPEVALVFIPSEIQNSKPYQELIEWGMDYQESAIICTIERLVEKDVLAGLILNDLFSKNYQKMKEQAYHRYDPDNPIIPTEYGNYIRLSEMFLLNL